MTTKNLSLLVLLSSTLTALSQPITSPEVLPDNRVTFRLRAPEASQVRLQCEGVKGAEMQKDDHGVWSFTSEPLEPDIYAYSFVIDGCHAIDPGNSLIKYNLLNIESQVHVPGPSTLPWELNDVPHGALHRHYYKSNVSGDQRDFMVYTPPGYDPSSRTRYPVLYLLHGYSDDTSGWTSAGFANVILDNLIARKQAKPMIVIMPLGYGTMDIVHAGWQRVREPGLWKMNQDKFRQGLLTEVMPQAEKAYRILPDPSAHALAGLSMGGAESLLVGLNNPDRFAWIGAFSSGGLGTNFSSQFPDLDEKINGKLRLLWIGCGEDDRLLGDNQKLRDWLQSKGVRLTWVQSPGQHSFRVWRRYLAQLAPLLFQETK